VQDVLVNPLDLRTSKPLFIMAVYLYSVMFSVHSGIGQAERDPMLDRRDSK